MLFFFDQYLFALIASGNLSPDLFIFTIYFLGFYQLCNYAKKHNGIGVKDYILIYFHRYFKLAPLYYFVFFAGWFIVPLLSTSSGWFVSERLYWNCESQWYYVLIFVNQLVPFFTKALEGCYYWPYIISCDLLTYTVFPLWIILYRRSKVVFYTFNSILLVGGMAITGCIAYYNNLTVGILTFEDYYLYAYEFNKPYTKGVAMSLGMFMAIFYMRLLEYREAHDGDKRKKFPIIYYTKKFFIFPLYIYGGGMILFIASIPLTANQDAYSWTRAQNTTFFTLGRLGYISGVCAIIIAIFLSNNKIVQNILSNKVFRPLSKLTFGAYLVYPISISLTYYATEKAIFVDYIMVVYSFIVNVAVAYLIAFGLYLTIEAPIANVIHFFNCIMTKKDPELLQNENGEQKVRSDVI